MELPSGLGLPRKAWRAVTGAALALLVVGAGASLGMGGPAHTARLRSAAAGGLAAGPGGSTQGAGALLAPTTTTTSVPPGTAIPAGAVAASRSQAGDPGPVAAATGAASRVPAAGAVPGPASGGVPAATATTVAPANPGGGAAPGSRLPATGTYTYDTTGSQQVSILGATNYPSRTPVVVSGDGCGVSSTWKPSSGESETVVECPASGGLRVLSESSTVSQDGYSTTQDFTCGPDAFIPVTTGQVGQTWTWQCRSSTGETTSQVVKLLGPRTAVVGGIPVSADEVSVVSTLSGPEQGTMSSDLWLTSNATPVRETGDINVFVGAVTYKSNYDLQLVSLVPAS